ncbi:hypothetical protein DENIS_0250 [Desulfonema ishimotonii]|uniref:Uncharacterized protein n=1 Tax=Desulfonema ishimotonii TaxID=45657 RepID=A0A401FQS3_9BACT|nr:hypothetical protein [Desulfonema ishimotonii]GBC59313.1 hypothetical protein DENIS_0250 [Desulfonema ishimotonii]
MGKTRQANGHKSLERFSARQLQMVNDAVSTAEELVCNFYKMSASQWLRLRYDVKTLADLRPDEIVYGPFAQVIRYEARRKDASLGSSAYDFYQICLQDHAILPALNRFPGLATFPFVLYVVTHELIHIVRFFKFLQHFDASPDERLAEEVRVHERTHEILGSVQVPGIKEVLGFYRQWCKKCEPVDALREY